MQCNIMLDVETLSTGTRAVITSVGLVVFSRTRPPFVTDDLVTAEAPYAHSVLRTPAREHLPCARFDLNIQEQLEAGRRVDASTLAFWFGQARENPEGESRNLVENLEASVHAKCGVRDQLLDICTWIRDATGADPHMLLDDFADSLRVWGKGPHFDVTILDDLFTTFGMTPPWSYRSPRDVRTIVEAAKDFGSDPAIRMPEHMAHDPVDDALKQVGEVQRAFTSVRTPAEA